MSEELEDDVAEMVQHLIDVRSADDNTGVCKAQLRAALVKLIDERIEAAKRSSPRNPGTP